MNIQDKIKKQFIASTIELDGDNVKYLFDRETVTQEKINALEDSYNQLYDAKVIDMPFDDYLKDMEVEFINVDHYFRESNEGEED